MKLRIETFYPDKLAQPPPIIDKFSEGLLENDCYYKLGNLVEDELFNDEGQLMPIGTKVIIERIA